MSVFTYIYNSELKKKHTYIIATQFLLSHEHLFERRLLLTLSFLEKYCCFF